MSPHARSTKRKTCSCISFQSLKGKKKGLPDLWGPASAQGHGYNGRLRQGSDTCGCTRSAWAR